MHCQLYLNPLDPRGRSDCVENALEVTLKTKAKISAQKNNDNFESQKNTLPNYGFHIRVAEITHEILVRRQ